jgi:hypothetical protein
MYSNTATICTCRYLERRALEVMSEPSFTIESSLEKKPSYKKHVSIPPPLALQITTTSKLNDRRLTAIDKNNNDAFMVC